MAWRSEVWTDAEEADDEDWRKNTAEARAKKRSEGRGRREVASEMRRERERMRKRKRTAADWREVKRCTGVLPLRRGSESEEIRVW